MADLVIQAQSTAFRRAGSTSQQRTYPGLNSLYTNIVSTNLLGSLISSSLAAAEQTRLALLLGQNVEEIPGGLTLYNIHALSNTAFTGQAFLEALLLRDPDSTAYQTATEAAFEESFAVARSMIASTPVNVRGGTARQAFELAELDTQISLTRWKELTGRYDTIINQNLQATQLLQATLGQIRRDQLQAQQQQAATEQGQVMQTLAASDAVNKIREASTRMSGSIGEFLGWPTMTVTEALEGQGVGQSGTATTFGSTIFR